MRHGEPIERYTVAHSISTGITYGVSIGGLVPDYEEHTAMLENNLNVFLWKRLGWYERAKAIAWLRIKRLEQLNQSDAQQAAVKPPKGKR